MADRDDAQTPLDRLFADLGTHLSVDDLMALLGLSRGTVYRLLQNGQLPAYRAGSNWVILRDEVREFLEDTRNTTPAPSGNGPG